MRIQDFQRKKLHGSKICMLTCYDYPSACVVAESKIDCVLVGDSVAMTLHGYPNTIMATLEMMVMHTQAVAKGLKDQFLVTDLPFLCHKMSVEKTVSQVKQIMQAGAQAIKIEGGDAHTCETIAYLTAAGIPVMGHIGLTPQLLHQLGGFKVQGKTADQEQLLLQQALQLQQAGCFAVVIECVPQHLGKVITESLNIPTIGIGAGADTDGQILVWHDVLGLQDEINPKFVKKFAQGNTLFLNAINDYVMQVNQQHFPAPEHAF